MLSPTQLNPVKRVIKIFHQAQVQKIDEIVLDSQQFMALRSQLDFGQDEQLLQVYNVSLEQCLQAGIVIVAPYLSGEYEFFLHSYLINVDKSVYLYGNQ